MPVSASGEKLARFFECDAHLVFPVDLVGGEGDEPIRLRLRRFEVAPDLITRALERLCVAETARCEPRQTVDPR